MTGTMELRGVSVTRGQRTLLHPVDLEVAPGAWLGIVGPNGAGKSTLLRTVAGITPHTGSVEVCGVPLGGMGPRERARLVAFSPQQPMVPPGASVVDYVLLGRTAHVPLLGPESVRDRAVVAEVLDLLELDDLATREVTTLSGGERQRAVIARALAQEAPILLLDEPTTALDIGHQQQVLELVDRLRRERSLTVVSAMHDLTLAAQHADRFMLLHHGRIHAAGTAREVFSPTILEQVFGATVTVVDDDGDLVVVPRRSRRAPGGRGAAEPSATAPARSAGRQ
jgi:iron complex transport system ATP-binding protein